MDNTPTNAHRRKLLVGVATAAAAVPLVAGLAACQGSGEQENEKLGPAARRALPARVQKTPS